MLFLFQIVDRLYDRYRHLLESLDLVWLDLEFFSEAIHTKGAPLTQCWGFIDGTARPICRPIRNQGIMYSGHAQANPLPEVSGTVALFCFQCI